MKNPLISVLISSYNHENFIEDCIKSIWKQNYQNIEILVIDDNSSDKTYEILKELKKISPYPMYISKNKENQGISTNLNKLINKAKGNIISFMSSDDSFCNFNIFNKIPLIFEENNKIKVIYTEGLLWDGNNTFGKAQGKLESKLIKEKNYNKLYHYMITNVPLLLIQGSFMKKEFLIEIGGFDEELIADDWVLNIKILKKLLEKNYDIIFLDEITFLYRQHENNSIKKRDYLLKLILEVIEKYTPEIEKRTFLANIYWGHGSFLLKHGKIKEGFKYLLKSQKESLSFFRILKSFFKLIKNYKI